MYKSITTIALSLCFISNSFAANSPSVEQFLYNEKLIRVCLSTGPGFGDQANAVNVMNHLRELGYHGKFEVVYENQVLDVVTTVFNLPKKIPDVYKDNANQITFMELDAYKNKLQQNKIDWADFGFSMGKSGLTCDIEISHTKTFANFLPYYDKAGGNHDATTIQVYNKGESEQQNSGNKYLISPFANYEQANEYLRNDPNGKNILLAKPALKQFLTSMDNQDVNVMFLYGFTLQLEGNGNIYQASNILQTLAGLRYAQINGPVALKKPMIVAVFYDYKKDIDTILQLVNSENWGQLEAFGASDARASLQEVDLKNNLLVADVADPKTIEIIKNLQPGNILLLSLGTLPKTVFDGIYMHTAPNILPQVHEGAGTFNTLITIGRPHFECAQSINDTDTIDLDSSNWTPGFDLVSNAKIKNDLQALYNVSNGYCALMFVSGTDHYDYAKSWQARIYNIFGQLVIDAYDDHSAFSEYFVDLKKDVFKPGNDRVVFALEEVIKEAGLSPLQLP